MSKQIKDLVNLKNQDNVIHTKPGYIQKLMQFSRVRRTVQLQFYIDFHIIKVNSKIN